MLKEMVDRGLITAKQLRKALEDAKRYRALLDLQAKRTAPMKWMRELTGEDDNDDDGY